MAMAPHTGTPLTLGAGVTPNTLRARMEELRASGSLLSLRQALGIVVPLCVQIADLHQAGHQLFIHPSSICEIAAGKFQVSLELAQRPPLLPRDKSCFAPEERSGMPGTARASVFAVAAILYEMITGLSVGPGMRRPSEVVPSLPPALEGILAKALVADPVHRPDDLYALAQAFHQLTTPGSLPPPPPADVSHLDHDGQFEVDISISLLPPKIPNEAAARAPERTAPRDATSELAALKQRLESDPRPRYVVVKDGMDHGPFTAVELLQQIANHTFSDADIIRDALSKDERPIKDWDEFAPFAEHARLNRDLKAEKEAIVRGVAKESRQTRSKVLLGSLIVVALLGAAGAWYVTAHGKKNDEVAVQADTLLSIETDAGLAGQKMRKGGGAVTGRSGGFPVLAGGLSCEAAQASYVEEMNVAGPKGQADITAGQYGSLLNSGNYFSHCGVPDSVGISICAAVQNGRAVGVSVSTKPHNRNLESCISQSVRRLNFPSHPKLDVTRTNF